MRMVAGDRRVSSDDDFIANLELLRDSPKKGSQKEGLYIYTKRDLPYRLL